MLIQAILNNIVYCILASDTSIVDLDNFNKEQRETISNFNVEIIALQFSIIETTFEFENISIARIIEILSIVVVL